MAACAVLNVDSTGLDELRYDAPHVSMITPGQLREPARADLGRQAIPVAMLGDRKQDQRLRLRQVAHLPPHKIACCNSHVRTSQVSGLAGRGAWEKPGRRPYSCARTWPTTTT
jgi:hypothetical protein